MAEVTRAEATGQVRRTISAYRDRVHEVRNDTDCLPPEGAQIVDEYCSFDNDWQDLVQDAVREASFLDGMDDGLLLEYCAVCKELDGALGLDTWRIGKIVRIIGVADFSYSEKIKKAIGYSDILGEILEEVGDINALVVQMVAVWIFLSGLALTGYGAAAEFALLAVGAAFAGTDFLKGIARLVKFFTTVDDAKTEDDLKACGRLFGDAVAKIGVNGLFFVLSMFGLKKASKRITAKTVADSNPVSGKWTWKSFKENVLKIGEAKAGKTPQIEDIVGKKVNELTAVPDDYVLVHYTDGEGIVQTSIRRRKSGIGEFLFVDEKGYVSNTKDVKHWKRENTVGSTPGKTSKTGQAVIKRMEREGKIWTDKDSGLKRVLSERDNTWYKLEECDMSHKENCVTYWNREGRKYGPLSPEVREWMTTADNYYLEYYGYNRSDGGKMTERYLPPVDNE